MCEEAPPQPPTIPQTQEAPDTWQLHASWKPRPQSGKEAREEGQSDGSSPSSVTAATVEAGDGGVIPSKAERRDCQPGITPPAKPSLESKDE